MDWFQMPMKIRSYKHQPGMAFSGRKPPKQPHVAVISTVLTGLLNVRLQA